MRSSKIVVGKYYRHKNSPTFGWAKALSILRPKPAYKCTEEFEKIIKYVVVKCEWTIDHFGIVGTYKYFKPADLMESE